MLKKKTLNRGRKEKLEKCTFCYYADYMSSRGHSDHFKDLRYFKEALATEQSRHQETREELKEFKIRYDEATKHKCQCSIQYLPNTQSLPQPFCGKCLGGICRGHFV